MHVKLYDHTTKGSEHKFAWQTLTMYYGHKLDL
jgi:hypothetical protein